MAITDSFAELAAHWEDKPEVHDEIIHAFDKAVAECEPLRQHREWCEINSWGFGHRAFHWCWSLFVKEAPDNFKFLELGVHRGQSISAVALCSILQSKTGTIYGISPMDGTGGNYYERKNYEEDIQLIFKRFSPQISPILIKGLSDDRDVLDKAVENGPYMGLYVDADHDYEPGCRDLDNYMPLVAKNGFLFVDDSAMNLQCPNWWFKGFKGISDAVDQRLPPKTNNKEWLYQGNLMHMRVWRKT